jgi:hypothetical protein
VVIYPGIETLFGLSEPPPVILIWAHPTKSSGDPAMCNPNCSMRTRYCGLLCELRKNGKLLGIERPLTSPDGTEEGMVAVNVPMPREVKLKGLKEAPHSAIYRT